MLNLSGDYKKITQIYLSSLKARDCRLEVQRLNSERPEEEEREGEARLEALRQAREAAAFAAAAAAAASPPQRLLPPPPLVLLCCGGGLCSCAPKAPHLEEDERGA